MIVKRREEITVSMSRQDYQDIKRAVELAYQHRYNNIIRNRYYRLGNLLNHYETSLDLK